MPPDGPDPDVPKRFWWEAQSRDLDIEDKAWKILVCLWGKYAFSQKYDPEDIHVVDVSDIARNVFDDVDIKWVNMKHVLSKVNTALVAASEPIPISW